MSGPGGPRSGKIVTRHGEWRAPGDDDVTDHLRSLRTTLSVIPTGAKRSGGTSSVDFPTQVPPLGIRSVYEDELLFPSPILQLLFARDRVGRCLM